MIVCVTIDCRAIAPGPGIRVRNRETFDIWIPRGFPYAYPSVMATHRRWLGTPHVHWGAFLCLYATSADWDPADGMYGFLDRLWLWLERAAAGELDPADAPLHPPVNYGIDVTMPLIVPRVDTPALSEVPWIGVANLDRNPDRRGDIVGWTDLGALRRDGWPEHSALALLLPEPFGWEYPEKVSALLAALERQGVPRRIVLSLLELGAFQTKDDTPLVVVVGTPMRRIGGVTRQHLVAWAIEAPTVTQLVLQTGRELDEPRFQEIGEQAAAKIEAWANKARVKWCRVREDRPEITVRRDAGSPLEWFAGRTVSVWGCGAIGGQVAEALLRARVKKLVLYDSAPVAPGVLARQPYVDDDIGFAKANRLRRRLEAIYPGAVELESRVENLLNGALDRDNWTDGAEVVIDATASLAVASKLERVRKDAPQDAYVVSLAFGHDAKHGLATVSNPAASAGPYDVVRQAKLACRSKDSLRPYADEFWPDEPRADLLQPEPGCSEPTFVGAHAEVAALAQTMLVAIAIELAHLDGGAVALLHALPAVDAPRHVRLVIDDGIVLADTLAHYEVRVARRVMEEIRAHIAHAARETDPSHETGGLLFGERDDATRVVWISEVIGPPPDSRSSASEFVCGTEGVDDHRRERKVRGAGSLGFVGMWHTHPGMRAIPSVRDVAGMGEIVLADDRPIPRSLLLIVGGGPYPNPALQLGAYLFDLRDLRPPAVIRAVAEPSAVPARPPPERNVGLALSGGGFRAAAFHLGCLRALHDRGVLERVRVISAVSGGSLAAALYAYGDGDFAAFDEALVAMLRRGLAVPIARRALLGTRALATAATVATAGAAAAAARAATAADWLASHLPALKRETRRFSPPLRRWSSATEAFVDELDALLAGAELAAVRRGGADVVFNACDLRSASAFRFGSRGSRCWRYGDLADNGVPVALAVAASAAYPILLPALDCKFAFTANGETATHRVVLTDGGVFDNLGTTLLEPGRSADYSIVYDVDYVIACDAGRGLLSSTYVPYGWPSRMRRSFESVFRKVHDGARGRLHLHDSHGDLDGFVLSYLGMQDARLPVRPPQLPRREAVADYPTDFAAMTVETIELLAARGEQLTRLLIDWYCPEL